MPIARTIKADELHRIIQHPPADRILPNGRISLRDLKFGSETGVNKCDLHALNFDLSNCDFRGAMLTTDNLKQLLKMRANDRVPLHNNRIDIRGANLTENQKMFKSSASINFDVNFSYEINDSIRFFRQKRNLPQLPAAEAPAVIQVVPNENNADQQRAAKRHRPGG